MPNWCYNTIHIEGNNDDLAELKTMMKGDGDFDFNKILPYPKKYANRDRDCQRYEELMARKQTKGLTQKDTKEAMIIKFKYDINGNAIVTDGYNSGGYEWCCNNWGTKWNAREASLDEGDRCLDYSFDTPWGAPMPVFLALSNLFPNLTFDIHNTYEGSDEEKDIVLKDGRKVNGY